MKPFDYLNAINSTKENLMHDSANDQLAEKAYAPFLTNRGLSYFPDSIFYANEMNRYHVLPKKAQFLYLLNSIRPRKRFSKWYKEEISDDILLISEMFGYSKAKAKEALNVLSEEQLKEIRKKADKGG